MLAYVFWHKPFPDVCLEEYEAALAEFHKRLGAASCPGFRGSIAYRISETPWLGQDRAYEDWNFVDGSWALDPLNRWAVSGAMEGVHGRIASLMKVGHGGLYCLHAGAVEPATAARVLWLKRPRGVHYQPILERLLDQARTPVSCWRRQMVLGPGHEFAIAGESPLDIAAPNGWEAVKVKRQAVWPE
jgi:hypothetical protein